MSAARCVLITRRPGLVRRRRTLSKVAPLASRPQHPSGKPSVASATN